MVVSYLGSEIECVDMTTDGNRGPDPSDKTGEIIKALRTYERPFMGTGELAEELGYSSNPGVTKHLKRAVESDSIQKTTISGYNVWYLPDLVSEAQVQATDTGPAPGNKDGQPSDDHSQDGKREKDTEKTARVHSIAAAFDGVSDHIAAYAIVVGAVAVVVNSIGIMVAMVAILAVSLMAPTMARRWF